MVCSFHSPFFLFLAFFIYRSFIFLLTLSHLENSEYMNTKKEKKTICIVRPPVCLLFSFILSMTCVCQLPYLFLRTHTHNLDFLLFFFWKSNAFSDFLVMCFFFIHSQNSMATSICYALIWGNNEESVLYEYFLCLIRNRYFSRNLWILYFGSNQIQSEMNIDYLCNFFAMAIIMKSSDRTIKTQPKSVNGI